MTTTKKRLIAHRGLFNGPDASAENKPSQVEQALLKGFDAEVDIWHTPETGFALGHDSPDYPVDFLWIATNADRLWLHAKNLDALRQLINLYNVFWHENDQHTLTSKGYVWSYPGVKTASTNGIMVMPEYANIPLQDVVQMDCYGICSDYVEEIKGLEQ